MITFVSNGSDIKENLGQFMRLNLLTDSSGVTASGIRKNVFINRSGRFSDTRKYLDV
jgi:hypothetical protein